MRDDDRLNGRAVCLLVLCVFWIGALVGFVVTVDRSFQNGKELGIREGVEASVDGRAYIYHAMNSDDQDDILVWID